MSSNVWNKTSKQLEPFAGIPVDLLTSLTNEVGRAYGFVGTKQEWIDLPTSEKAKYVVVNLTDDDPYLIGGHDISGIGDGTVSGALVQLDADLGDKSSASAVTGNDAFAKIDTLNSDLSNLSTIQNITYQATVNTSTVASYVNFAVIKCGRVVQVFLGNVVFKANGDNQVIVTGLPEAANQCSNAYSGATAAETATILSKGDTAWIAAGNTQLHSHIGIYQYRHWITLVYITLS